MLLDESGLEESLPFSAAKQEGLVGHLLTSERLFQQAQHRIKADWFSNPKCRNIWATALSFAQAHNTIPTVEEVKDHATVFLKDTKEANEARLQVELALKRRADFHLEPLRAELTDWLKARIYIAGVNKSATLFNNSTKRKNAENLQKAFQQLRDMNREADEASFEDGQAQSMNMLDEMAQQRKDMERALTFGLPAVDNLLLPGNGAGSLLPGDTTVMLAPTNVGKTTNMVTVAVANILCDKDVLLVTHEGRPKDIRRKLWMCITGYSGPALDRWMSEPKNRPMYEKVLKQFNEHLLYIPLNNAGMTVEDVAVVIRRAQDKWVIDHGKGFDLMVDDYAAKLTTQQAMGGQFSRRNIDEIVYHHFVQLALEFDWHCLTAIQTNREGSKMNRGFSRNKFQEPSRLLSMEDVLESWGPMTAATNVISINRDPVAMAKGLVTFYICKSRSSETGWAIVCKSDYGCARTHHPTLPVTWYQDDAPMTKRIDDFLQTYQGGQIPFELLHKKDD